MGRFSTRATCEELLALDLSYLRRRDMLRPGKVTTLTWSQLGHQVASIRLIAQAEGIGLSYRTRREDGEPLDVVEAVPFIFTATNFGGRRAWFACPGCRRPCRVLYNGGRRFRCRRCYGLAYNSQRERYYQSAMRQANRIRKRLADKLGAFDDEDFPAKPPRMRWATYEAAWERYTELQNQGFGGIMSRLLR